MRFFRFSIAAVLTAFLGSLNPVSAQNRLVNPPGTVDGLLQIEGAAQLLAGARAEGVQASRDGSGIELTQGSLAGSVTLAPQRTQFPFNEALPSWNGWAPKNGGFRIYMRAASQNRGGGESPWLVAGSWGKVPDDDSSPPESRISRRLI